MMSAYLSAWGSRSLGDFRSTYERLVQRRFIENPDRMGRTAQDAAHHSRLACPVGAAAD